MEKQQRPPQPKRERPAARYDSAAQSPSWDQQAEERRAKGFPTWTQTEEPERWRR